MEIPSKSLGKPGRNPFLRLPGRPWLLPRSRHAPSGAALLFRGGGRLVFFVF